MKLPLHQWLWLLLSLQACEEVGQAQFQAAQRGYASAVWAHADPQGAEYAAVLRQLEAIPNSSKYYAQAQQLMRNIRSTQRPVHAPLAIEPKAGGLQPADIKSQLARCVSLLKTFASDGGVTPHERQQLAACQQEAERRLAHEP
jgi:hypothetical protein